MFTGLVTAVGTIREARRDADGLELVIESPYDDVEEGESIAVDGACLSVTGVGQGEFVVHVVATSLDRTKFGHAVPGVRVNLERALRLTDRLGGHLVQGHVDGVGRVLQVTQRDDARLLDLEVPDPVARVSIPLGSIAVDGVSMTVNAIPEPGRVQISLIPITLERSTLGEREVGDAVHLEADMVGKYVASLLGAWTQTGDRPRA